MPMPLSKKPILGCVPRSVGSPYDASGGAPVPLYWTLTTSSASDGAWLPSDADHSPLEFVIAVADVATVVESLTRLTVTLTPAVVDPMLPVTVGEYRVTWTMGLAASAAAANVSSSTTVIVNANAKRQVLAARYRSVELCTRHPPVLAELDDLGLIDAQQSFAVENVAEPGQFWQPDSNARKATARVERNLQLDLTGQTRPASWRLRA
jgi:hypothetical protein